MVDAKLPQKGDSVVLIANIGIAGYTYTGTVDDIGNGFICLDSASVSWDNQTMWNGRNVCIGIGTISMLLVK